MIIDQTRTYQTNYTISDLLVNGIKFCFVLEDVGRPAGIKIPGETCIPEGVYSVAITFSNRFQRDMLQLYDQEDMSVGKNGVRFTGIRAHGGNEVDDTEGCPLIAFNYNRSTERIWQRADKELLKLARAAIDRGEVVKWIIGRAG